MANVLRLDAASGSGIVSRDLVTMYSEVFVTVDVAFSASYLTGLLAQAFGHPVLEATASTSDDQALDIFQQSSVAKWAWDFGTPTTFTPATAITSLQFYTVEMHVTAGSPFATQFWIDGVSVGALTISANLADIQYLDLRAEGGWAGLIYFDNFKAGTTRGASDIYADDFSGDLSGWTNAVNDATIIADPGIDPPSPVISVPGRVLIAFDDGPLTPFPTFTAIDQGGSFPQNFVAGYDIRVGRQTLLSQTDTGTATVTCYDRTGLFDPRNVSSPYYGKLDGRPIILQLYNPVTTTWEPQFRGLIDDITWDVDGSAVNSSGKPVNETITLNCVDMFDYLAGYGLTPGLDGVTPPAGAEDGVYYAATSGSVDDRIIEILADVNIDPSMYNVASGNVHAKEVKYDPDESALQALRDAADAEMPFIANIYCDHQGRFAFRGRYARFNSTAVAGEPGSDWDFTYWKVGDGAAILSDPTRAQMRVLSFGRARSDIVNAALCYPQGCAATAIPGQVFADTTSITNYGKHSAPPMSDLLCNGGVDSAARPTGTTDLVETALFAELLVKNQKDPRENITAIQLKAINASDGRASATWGLITLADISHKINVAVGYPGGTGFTGAATADDYFIEGRQLRVTPANTTYDYVELDLDLSPAIWSMDTHGVFPAFPG